MKGFSVVEGNNKDKEQSIGVPKENDTGAANTHLSEQKDDVQSRELKSGQHGEHRVLDIREEP